MFELQCTVRNCDETLSLSEQGLTCSNRHHFDRARTGYWNLLQPQDRKSANPGDSDDAVLARHRWLARGHMEGLVQSLRPWISIADTPPTKTPRTFDLGCGEGSFGKKLFPKEAAGYCGIDLSKRAMKLAARGWPEATWVLANADRFLPAQSESVDRVVSLFGRRPTEEIERVLAPGGICIVAVPAAEDLIELREQVQKEGIRRNRWESIAEQISQAGLTLESHKVWSHRVTLDLDAIRDVLAMTYRAVRNSQRTRMESLEATEVTLAADLMLFRKATGT
ncbi:MAG: putative RNA methyltransferase [Planctomycetota bacterium]